jgi:hypothetical protein
MRLKGVQSKDPYNTHTGGTAWVATFTSDSPGCPKENLCEFVAPICRMYRNAGVTSPGLDLGAAEMHLFGAAVWGEALREAMEQRYRSQMEAIGGRVHDQNRKIGLK